MDSPSNEAIPSFLMALIPLPGLSSVGELLLSTGGRGGCLSWKVTQRSAHLPQSGGVKWWHVRNITAERTQRVCLAQRRERSNRLRTILNNTESPSPCPSPSDLRTSSSPGVALCSRTRRRAAARRSARSGKAANAVVAGTETGLVASSMAQAWPVPAVPLSPPLTWLRAVPSRNG